MSVGHFISLLVTITFGGALVMVAADSKRRTAAWVILVSWLCLIAGQFARAMSTLAPFEIERNEPSPERAFIALVALFLLILPFVTWPLSEHRSTG